MFVVFGVDYLDRDNRDFFDENGNIIKYNINIDDMPTTCLFVTFMSKEEDAKKFCKSRNEYCALVNKFVDLPYYFYCKYYEDQMLLHNILEMRIEYKTYLEHNAIEINSNIYYHPDKISKNLLDEFIKDHSVDSSYDTLFITPEENESLEDLLNRGLNKCIEFIIKNHEFNDDGKIYKYISFNCMYTEIKWNIYNRLDHTEDMIHIEDRFKD